MSQFTWILQDAGGEDIRTSQSFATQEEAEAWMGAEWAALREEGAEFVSLRDGDQQVYRMGLSEG